MGPAVAWGAGIHLGWLRVGGAGNLETGKVESYFNDRVRRCACSLLLRLRAALEPAGLRVGRCVAC